MQAGKSSRRRHSAEFKAQVLAECAQPGTSIAGVALAHDLNLNLVHKWRGQVRRSAALVAAPVAPAFVEIPMTSGQDDHPLVIELQGSTVRAKLTWPVADAASCAAFLREILQ